MYNVLSNPTVRGCAFLGNVADLGGGGVKSFFTSGATFTNCIFRRNSAGSGGGMSGDGTLSNCVFLGNSAAYRGGGMGGEGTLTNCTFLGNSAGEGGGMSGKGTLTNCTFMANVAEEECGAIRITRGNITNCTLAWNSDPEGSVCVLERADVTNSILFHNTSGEIGTRYTHIEHSDIAGGWDGVGNIDADPLFVRTPNNGGDGWGDDPETPGIDEGANDDWGDLHLTAGSPCIDAGDNTASGLSEIDFEGEPRIQNCRVDMGADESPFFADCNGNGLPDACEIADGTTSDTNGDGVPDVCERHLDIMPGICPNRLNTRAHGKIQMAIVGNEHFDVADIELDSLYLTLADDFASTVAPLTHPRGLAQKTKDVATPFFGELCECHTSRRDGLPDLVLHFSAADVLDAVDRGSVRSDAPMMLAVRGLLKDGTAFVVRDCVSMKEKGRGSGIRSESGKER
jgi:hypothetical protein